MSRVLSTLVFVVLMLTSAELSAQVSVKRVFCQGDPCPQLLELVHDVPITIELRGDGLNRLESGTTVGRTIGSAVKVQLGRPSDRGGHRRMVTLTAQSGSITGTSLSLQFRTKSGKNVRTRLQVRSVPPRHDLAVSEIRVIPWLPQLNQNYSFEVFVSNQGNFDSGNINLLCQFPGIPYSYFNSNLNYNVLQKTYSDPLPLAVGETRMLSRLNADGWIPAGTYQIYCYWWPASPAPEGVEDANSANDRLEIELEVPLLPAVLKEIRLSPPPQGEESHRGGERIYLSVYLETRLNGAGPVDVQFSSSRPDIVPVPSVVTLSNLEIGRGFGDAVYSSEVTEATPVTFTATLGSVTKTLTMTVVP